MVEPGRVEATQLGSVECRNPRLSTPLTTSLLQSYAKTPCFSEFLTKSGTLKNGCTKSYLNYLQPPIALPNYIRIR
jgi:hypothetical protein